MKMKEMLTQEEAGKLVQTYMKSEGDIRSTQDILDSGAVPRLKDYTVRPGKVSDSVFGGRGDYLDKQTGETVEFENPPLNAADGTPLRIMVRTERISTHDVNRGSIPFKDQILAYNHNFSRDLLRESIGTSQYDVEGLAANAIVIVAEDLKQLAVENVVRAFMAKSSTSTSLYQHFIKGIREFCGHKLPDNLITNGPLPYVMDTPSTKSDEHDESVAPHVLFKRGVCTPHQYAQLRNGAIFAMGKIDQHYRPLGIIPVDTKTEHGVNRKGEIVSQDELWTMDSSRFWLLGDYNQQMEQFLRGDIEEIAPKSYSKEFARGFSKGDEGYDDETRAKIAVRYIEGLQTLLGKRFVPDMKSREERVITGLETVVDRMVA